MNGRVWTSRHKIWLLFSNNKHPLPRAGARLLFIVWPAVTKTHTLRRWYVLLGAHCFILKYNQWMCLLCVHNTLCSGSPSADVTRYAERARAATTPSLVTQLVVKFLLFIRVHPTFICLPCSHCQRVYTSRFLITLSLSHCCCDRESATGRKGTCGASESCLVLDHTAWCWAGRTCWNSTLAN